MKLNNLWDRLKTLSKIKLISLIILTITVLAGLFIFLVGFSFQQKHKNDEVKFGVSFSTKYAQELGLDWRQNYLDLLEDLNIKYYRLMSYWDLIEPDMDRFDFTDLDWQMNQAAEHGAKVSLAIGQRQPRWPECHIPVWASSLSEDEYQNSLLNMLETLIIRYKDHPALDSYQLENEARNQLFGDCHPFDMSLFKKEVDLIKSLDQENLLIINASNQMGVPLLPPVGDGTGFSLYKRAHFEALGKTWSWNYWYVPSWWHSYRAGILELMHGSKTFVHELQGEPWGAKATRDLTSDEQYQTMDSEKLAEIIEFSLDSGMKEFYLWGGEWWYWRLTKFDDPIMWDAVKNQMNIYQQ